MTTQRSRCDFTEGDDGRFRCAETGLGWDIYEDDGPSVVVFCPGCGKRVLDGPHYKQEASA